MMGWNLSLVSTRKNTKSTRFHFLAFYHSCFLERNAYRRANQRKYFHVTVSICIYVYKCDPQSKRSHELDDVYNLEGFRTLPFFRLICCILEASVQSFLWIGNAQRERHACILQRAYAWMFRSIETRDQTEYATLFFQHSLDTILNALSHIFIYIYICCIFSYF